ncbi:hypothetical protein SAMN04487969_15511 [Paenibacillus algorifonticola]|uniref:Uncharacterized protein n=1 Tax=Paenibacillus algorifonticola TaxID=684063 RepID=A0A1I2J6C2_9BACL|nr:hypothetical protein [Paenibacillus algorifonticola]SFF49393.1 hypothetical protein SAMN04487969_15511 [Paenibacillus algorifonticola]
MMAFLYKLFAKVTRKGLLTFAIKRLPVYLAGLTILMIWGVPGVMMTFLLVMAFFFGWFLNKFLAAIKDYRLTQRLNRIHFTHIEFDTMRRERDMAIQAYQMVMEADSKGRRVKAAGMPPTPVPPSNRAYDPDTIREYMRQHGNGEEMA